MDGAMRAGYTSKGDLEHVMSLEIFNILANLVTRTQNGFTVGHTLMES